MAEDEITALKVALCNQLLTMKRLHAELEEEREASASGADEALSMILRLQKEKAEEKLEHCQYKKMTEAKMQHLEESLAVLEDVLFQKELENASLLYQVQAYRQKLLCIGVGNADLDNIAILDNRIFLKRSTSLERTRFRGSVCRQLSMPSIQLNKLCSEVEIVSGDGSLFPSLQSIWREIDVGERQKQKRHFSREAVIEECSSDSEQVQELDKSLDNVRQNSESLSLNKESWKKRMIDPQSYKEADDDCSMKVHRPFILRKAPSMNYQSNRVEPAIVAASSETEVQELKHRLQQVEDDICIMKQEYLTKGNKEFELLREMHDLLHKVQSCIWNLFSTEHSPRDVALFDSLTEAMLSFSI